MNGRDVPYFLLAFLAHREGGELRRWPVYVQLVNMVVFVPRADAFLPYYDSKDV